MYIKIISIEDDAYPDNLRRIKKPPKNLYVLGDETLLKGKNIAVIGSRSCTEYGQKQAEIFTMKLACSGLNIVSGMAIGIDETAHKACIDIGGKTIAVLGSGFNNIYPEENRSLFYEILESGGLVITEYEPDEEIKNYHFPARNRIISGISMGVLVIEAAYRSGTSITARYAKSQGKDVYCIPSNVDSNKSVGIARLIRNGAKIVLKPDDILKEYNIAYKKNDKLVEQLRKLPPIYVETYLCIENNGTHINNIAKKAKKSIKEVNQELFMLELEGYVEKIAGGYYVPKT